MKTYTVFSAIYGGALGALADKLERAGAECSLEGSRLTVIVNDGEEEKLSFAVADFILNDVMRDRMRRVAGMYPLSEDRVQRAVENAAGMLPNEDAAEMEKLISEHFAENDMLVPEGFLRFRRPDLLESWALEADRAALDIAAGSELEELCSLVSLLSGAHAVGMGNMRLLLLPDGSSVLSDDSGCRIECGASDETVISALIDSFRPETLTVFDLSPDGMPELRRRIRAVFGERAVVFVGNGNGNNGEN